MGQHATAADFFVRLFVLLTPVFFAKRFNPLATHHHNYIDYSIRLSSSPRLRILCDERYEKSGEKILKTSADGLWEGRGAG